MDRVFTPDERRLIRDSSDPDGMLWSLWAGKETGYKAVRRRYPAVSSAPRRYEIHLPYTRDHVPESGTVHTPCGPVSIRLCITGDYVHCVGAMTVEGVEAIFRDVQEIPGNRSSSDGGSGFVREMARRCISVYLDERPEAVKIIRLKEDRGLAPPVVRIERRTPAVNLSLSHDGRFAACAFSAYHARPDR